MDATVWTVIGSGTLAGIIATVFKYLTDRAAAKSAERAKSMESNAGERIAQYGVVPELIRRIEKLETQIEQQRVTMESEGERQRVEWKKQADRMERECIRMHGYIVQLHTDYLRAVSHADYADNMLKFVRADWVPHNLPRHELIPRFTDPS